MIDEDRVERGRKKREGGSEKVEKGGSKRVNSPGINMRGCY